jgi:hypothetical protein
MIQSVPIVHFRNQLVPTCLYTHVYTWATYYVMFNLLPSPNCQSLVSQAVSIIYSYLLKVLIAFSLRLNLSGEE